MMIDDILNGWDSFIMSKYGNELRAEERLGPGLDWNDIRVFMENAISINANNVALYVGENYTDSFYRQLFRLPNIRPPFEIMWIEWNPSRNVPIQVINAAGKRSNEKRDSSIKKLGCLFLSEPSIDHRGQKGIEIAVFTFRKTLFKDIFFVNSTHLFCNEQGEIEWTAPRSKYVENAIKEMSEGQKSLHMVNFILEPLMAISFMHCKNVQLIENKPPEKLQKARIRRKKIPLVTHYTLEISPVKKILSEEGHIEKTGIKQALHICRGHFKDYQDGRGLFGKYKGLYWWESQVRGSKDEGMIIKDYKVNPPKEVACK